jgi:hypothetical protein
MEDIRIYEISAEVLNGITLDLNESVYIPTNGTLVLKWSEEPTFNAYASSKSDIGIPPNHEICIHYELVRQLYRDIESFCEYYSQEHASNLWSTFFKDLDDAPPLFKYFTLEQCCFNMFVGALTFVYFHELGHLLQQHGYIRHRIGGSEDLPINEHQVIGEAILQGKSSSVSHVTELCADSYATTKCLYELMRQFDDNKEELRVALFILVCGLSCIFHKFSNEVAYAPIEEPIGSHPNPSIRMELNLPRIYEILDLVAEPSGHLMSRRELVHLCNRASDSSALYQLAKRGSSKEDSNYPFILGLLNRLDDRNYLKHIVDTWDDIESVLREVTIGGNELDYLSFTKEFRSFVNTSI